MGLTPPLSRPETVWIDMKKAQDSAQVVSSFVPSRLLPDAGD